MWKDSQPAVAGSLLAGVVGLRRLQCKGFSVLKVWAWAAELREDGGLGWDLLSPHPSPWLLVCREEEAGRAGWSLLTPPRHGRLTLSV